MIRGYIYEEIGGSLNYMHPVEAALNRLMYDLGVIGLPLPANADMAVSVRGIAFDAPESTAVEFNTAFVNSAVLSSNLRIMWVDPLPTGGSSIGPVPGQPEPAPEPAPDPTIEEPGPTTNVPITILPSIDFGGILRKYGRWIALGTGGYLLWLYIKRRDQK